MPVTKRDERVRVMTGNEVLEGMDPHAMAYAGHQFGNWVPRLGDGRAILLGELIASDGERHDLQLKGSGRTPYSRSGDGRAPLGPVIREYVLSEAMAALGIPTLDGLGADGAGAHTEWEHIFYSSLVERTRLMLALFNTLE